MSDKVILFASIEREQRDILRYLGYKENRSVASITREAIDKYIESKSDKYPNIKNLEK